MLLFPHHNNLSPFRRYRTLRLELGDSLFADSTCQLEDFVAGFGIFVATRKDNQHARVGLVDQFLNECRLLGGDHEDVEVADEFELVVSEWLKRGREESDARTFHLDDVADLLAFDMADAADGDTHFMIFTGPRDRAVCRLLFFWSGQQRQRTFLASGALAFGKNDECSRATGALDRPATEGGKHNHGSIVDERMIVGQS